ncbi:MAG TPA: N-acetyl-gamma-glutamyl-phosphate reductase, partial [Marinobacter sp.]|nr:N-acetyl-gamma-glutamyl-phosphate reductase [Marinobacter sp.]
PHLVPMIRGIEATLYAELSDAADFDRLQALYEERYRNEPFVDVMPFGSHPETRSVRGA